MADLLFGRSHFQLERRGFVLATLGALVPPQTEQPSEQIDKLMAGRKRPQQRFVSIFDLGPRNGLAELLAAAMAADIVRKFLVPPLHPVCGHGMIALPAGDKAAQRKILAHINTSGRIGLTSKPILIALEGFQRDHAFMVALAE